MMKNSRRMFTLVLVVILAATALSACKPALTAPEVMSQAVTNMKAIKTFAYSMQVEMTDQTDTIVVDTEGMVENPDKSYSITTQESQSIETLVLSDTEIYARLADTDAWQPVDIATMESAGLNVDFMKEQESIWAIYENPVLVDEVDLDGVKCYHLTYTIDVQKYVNLMLTQSLSSQIELENASINGELWVGKDDLLFHKNVVTMVYSYSSTEITSISTMNYSKLNQPVDIPQP